MAEIQKPKLCISSKSTLKLTSKSTLEKDSPPIQENHEKSQSERQSTQQSIPVKPQPNKQENVIEVEKEDTGPQVYFGTSDPGTQSIILCHILSNNLSLFEQIEMRRVCRLWHYNVKHIWAKTRSLVMTLKDVSMKPKLSVDFDHRLSDLNHFDSPSMISRVELIIGKNHWNHATIDLLGDLFHNIEHLTIFYEHDVTDNLCYFYQKFHKVKSFSFIVPIDCTVEKYCLTQLFDMINDHPAQLHTLHIYLPSLYYLFFMVMIKHFNKILPFLQNFSLNCTVRNLGEMLKTMGKSLPAHLSVQSLSINVCHEKSLSPVSTLFEQNSKLSQIKRLELTDLNTSSLNLVNCLLDAFKELECLYLWTSFDLSAKIKFTNECIEPLNKLNHLNELFLCNFEIQLLENWNVKSLPNIRKLTIVLWDLLFHSIKKQYYDIKKIDHDQDDVEPKLIYSQFLHSFAKQFPRLENLTIKHYAKLDETISGLFFTEFYHLKSLRLIDARGKVSIFTF